MWNCCRPFSKTSGPFRKFRDPEPPCHPPEPHEASPSAFCPSPPRVQSAASITAPLAEARAEERQPEGTQAAASAPNGASGLPDQFGWGADSPTVGQQQVASSHPTPPPLASPGGAVPTRWSPAQHATSQQNSRRGEDLPAAFQESSFPLGSLPDDCLEALLARVPLRSVCRLACVGRRWRDIGQSEPVISRHLAWLPPLRDHFPDLASATSAFAAVSRAKKGVASADGAFWAQVDPGTGRFTLRASVSGELSPEVLPMRMLWDAPGREEGPHQFTYWAEKAGVPGASFPSSVHIVHAFYFRVSGQVCPAFAVPPGEYEVGWRVAKDHRRGRGYAVKPQCRIQQNGNGGQLAAGKGPGDAGAAGPAAGGAAVAGAAAAGAPSAATGAATAGVAAGGAAAGEVGTEAGAAAGEASDRSSSAAQMRTVHFGEPGVDAPEELFSFQFDVGRETRRWFPGRIGFPAGPGPTLPLDDPPRRVRMAPLLCWEEYAAGSVRVGGALDLSVCLEDRSEVGINGPCMIPNVGGLLFDSFYMRQVA